MNIHEAHSLLEQGGLLTRPALRPRFLALRGGKLLLGSYVGETSLTEMRTHSLSAEEEAAQDWTPYIRVLPEEWAGCDAPDGWD